MMPIFTEISILLFITIIITFIVRILKQPLVVGYILSGIAAGPYFLDVLVSHHELELFSKVGIVFLLFIVGLHLNPKVIKEVGSISLITGIGQVIFTSIIGFVISRILGLAAIAAVYVSIALTFSSTIIILKLLADKRDLQKLYAKIAIGFLLVQDIIATFVLIGITVLTSSESASLFAIISSTIFKGIGIFIGLSLFSKYLLDSIAKNIASSQEMLFLFSLAWGTGLASVFAILGFSIEIGALVAGVVLSMTPYSDEMASRLKPLRDFFIIIFFILLGSQMVIGNIENIVIPAIVLSLFVLIGNPIIVIIIMNLTGYNRRTGFMAGLTVAQISEFSLILASLGLQVGHLNQETLSLVTLVGLITITGSTYLILYSDKIYYHVSKYLTFLELVKKPKKAYGANAEDFHSIIFGFDRVGHTFAEALKKSNLHFLVVDFNPKSIERLTSLAMPFQFGDASDVEFLDDLPVLKPQLIISTIPDVTTNKLILRNMRQKNKKVLFIPIAHTTDEARQLYELGAAYVIVPHHLGAEYAAQLIRKWGTDGNAYSMEKQKHIQHLEKHYRYST